MTTIDNLVTEREISFPEKKTLYEVKCLKEETKKICENYGLHFKDLISRGGQALVFEVIDELDTKYALKIAGSPQELELFFDPELTIEPREEDKIYSLLKEGSIHQKLSEKYPEQFPICYDYGNRFLLLEHLDNSRTAKISLAPLTYSYPTRIEVIKQMAECVKKVHDEGFIHRDIKPNNFLAEHGSNLIFYTNDTIGIDNIRFKLSDFGISRSKSEKEDSSDGTPRFMAPEQLSNPQGFDERGDVYSLMVIFDKFLNGRDGRNIDFMQNKSYDQLNNVLNRKARRNHLPELSSGMRYIIDAGTDPDVEKRPYMDEICDIIKKEQKKISQ